MRTVFAIGSVLLLLLAGCRPGIGEDAGVDLAGTDRIEVRDVQPGGWPPALRERAESDVADEGALVATITDAEEVERLVRALDGARLVDLGPMDYDLAEPDHEVVFLDGTTVLARLGYYEHASHWGVYRVEGRWLAGWDPLAVSVTLPPEPGS